MGSRREEERNEKIIRGLLKLPPNRKCINCNSLGPQYVCTNFWTFVCVICSGIHREFTHRVKSVSMAKFTSQEVEALEKGGNQRAREIYLKDWDMQRQRLPESSNVDKIREFIKNVYVDKKYCGGKSSDKPPRDLQSYKNHDEERRASSYHSYSQSPPYDYQYEDRRYGKQAGMLTRKPGSDRVHYDGKFSGLVYSPGRGAEDRFANEGSAPRLSDYSVSSAGEASRHGGQSPNFGKEAGYSSPPGVQVRNILIDDGRRQTLNTFLEADAKSDPGDLGRPPRSLRPESFESFGSFDSSSPSANSVKPASLMDAFGKDQLTGTLPKAASLPSTMQAPSVTIATDQDFFSSTASKHQLATSSAQSIDLFAEINNLVPVTALSVQKPVAAFAPSVDLFAHVNNPASSASLLGQSLGAAPPIENVGWATFDLPQNSVSMSAGMQMPPLTVQSTADPQIPFDAFSSASNNLQQFSLQSSSVQPGSVKIVTDPSTGTSHQTNTVPAPLPFQSWNAFDDTSSSTQNTFGHSSLDSKQQTSVHTNYPFDSSLAFLEGHGENNFPDFSGGVISDESAQQRKSTNPFDFPFESELTSSSGILDMSPLQSALPAAQFSNPLSNSAHWFPQFPVPAGALPYMASPSPQMPNLPPQGPVASLGGNPFA